MSRKRMEHSFKYLKVPITEAVFDDGTIEISAMRSFIYGAASMQGWRREQEDRFTCLANLCKNYSFFGLYDGHGGSEISEYLQENFHFEIEHFLESQDDVEFALYLGFLSTDSSLKSPAIIAELNAQLDAENRYASEQLAMKLHQPSLLDDLKKRGEHVTASKIIEFEKTIAEEIKNCVPLRKSTRISRRTKNFLTFDETRIQDVAGSSQLNAAGLSQDIIASTQSPSVAGSTQSPSVAGSTQSPSVAGSSRGSSVTGSTQDTDIASLNKETNVVGSIQDSNITGSIQELDVAGPSQECNSSTDEELEMDEGSYEEETDVSMGEIGLDEIEKPIDYLLNEDLESSDPEDEDFDVEGEDFESEGSYEEKSEKSRFNITLEEFANMQPGDLSGSTATVVLLNESTIHVANIGDSRCVLSRKGEAIDMSIDHKPTDAEEQERIVANGGVVRMGKINDMLDMSRAFGDFKLKGSSLIPTEQCVTAEPTIKSIPINIDDEFLVIASDGMWNCMSSQDIVDYVNMRLKIPNCDLKDVCNELFHLILAPNFENDGCGFDNMSCIIIKFIQRVTRIPVPGVEVEIPGLGIKGVPISHCRPPQEIPVPLHRTFNLRFFPDRDGNTSRNQDDSTDDADSSSSISTIDDSTEEDDSNEKGDNNKKGGVSGQCEIN